PIGRYTAAVLSRAGPAFEAAVRARVVSEELNVRQVLQKVLLGEADAGIVYRSDVPRDDSGVRAVALPAHLSVMAEYPIATVSTASAPTLAKAWVAHVLSEAGQRRLVEAGFLRAPAAVARP